MMKQWNWKYVSWGWFVLFLSMGILAILCLAERRYTSLSFLLWGIWIGSGVFVHYLLFGWLLPSARRIENASRERPKEERGKSDCFGGLLFDLRQSFDLLDETRAELDRMRQKNEHLEKEMRSLREDQIILEEKIDVVGEENEALVERHSNVANLFHQVLDQLKMGLFFVGKERIVQEEYTAHMRHILGDISLSGQDMVSIFSSFQPNVQKMEYAGKWIDEMIGAPAQKWRESPLENFIFKRQIQGKIVVKHLSFSFAPILKNGHVDRIMVCVQDTTAEKNLRKELNMTQTRSRTNIEYAVELMKLDPVLLKNFLDETEEKSKVFNEKLLMLHQGTLNRSIIYDLEICIDEIKNNAHLLKFRAIAQEAEKVKTLLGIVRNSQGGFRMEQLVEIEERINKFLELIGQYQTIGKKMVFDESQEVEKVETNLVSNPIKLLNLKQKYHYFARSVLMSSAYPVEVVRFLRQSKEIVDALVPSPKEENGHVFEFVDFFDRVLDSLRTILQVRKIKLELQYPPQRLLLHGDLLKVTNLISMFLNASLWRAEETSGLKIGVEWIPNASNKPDTLKIETVVSIRNTNPEALEKIKNWYKDVQVYCYECGGQLTYQKWGFSLDLPLVVNKLVGERFKIGLIGPWREKLQNVLQEIAPLFPCTFEIVPNPTDYLDLSMIMVEAEAMETLSRHIHQKMKRTNIPFVTVLSDPDEKTQENAVRQGAKEFVVLPFNPSDLKWCLFSCLDTLIAEKRQEPEM